MAWWKQCTESMNVRHLFILQIKKAEIGKVRLQRC